MRDIQFLIELIIPSQERGLDQGRIQSFRTYPLTLISDTNDVGIKVDAGCAGVDFFSLIVIE